MGLLEAISLITNLFVEVRSSISEYPNIPQKRELFKSYCYCVCVCIYIYTHTLGHSNAKTHDYGMKFEGDAFTGIRNLEKDQNVTIMPKPNENFGGTFLICENYSTNLQSRKFI